MHSMTIARGRPMMLAFLFMLSANAHALDQWWNGVKLDTQLGDYAVFLGSDQRMLEDESRLYHFNVKLGASTKLTDALSAGLEFRVENSDPVEDQYRDEQRLTPFASYKLRLSDYSADIRVRLENRWFDGDYSLRPRVRGKLSKKIDNIGLYASYEYFFNATKGKYNQSRSALGAELAIDNNLKVGAYLMLLDGTGDDVHILGSEFSYTF